MKKNNKGLSLVELIVVIAIMSILIGVMGVSIAWISRQKVINAAKDTKQEIQLARTYARSKGYCKISIKGKEDTNSESDNVYIYIYTANSQTDLSDPSLCRYGDGPITIYKRKIKTTVYYEDSSDNSVYGIVVEDPNDYCDLCFNRALGGYAESNYKGKDTNGILRDSTGIPTKIEFTNGDKVSTIVLARYTGTATIK